MPPSKRKTQASTSSTHAPGATALPTHATTSVSSEKPKRKSKSKPGLSTTSNRVTGPVTRSKSRISRWLPLDVMSLIAEQLGHSSLPTLLNLLLTSKSMYRVAIPYLYKTLILDSTTANKVFYGLDHSLHQDDDQSTATVEDIFGLDKASIHARKARSFRYTEGLNVQDIIAGHAAARAMNRLSFDDYNDCPGCRYGPLYVDESDCSCSCHHMEEEDEAELDDDDGSASALSSFILFPKVWRVTFGFDFLKTHEFFNDRQCCYLPRVHPVVRAFSTCLFPTHVCADWTASIWDKDRLVQGFAHIVEDWPVRTFTWHHVTSDIVTPYFPYQAETTRIFFDACEEYERLDFPPPVSECEDRVIDIVALAAGRGTDYSAPVTMDLPAWRTDNGRTVELVGLRCLGKVDAERIDSSGHIRTDVGGSSQAQSTSTGQGDSFKDRAKVFVTPLDEAEECICCGMK